MTIDPVRVGIIGTTTYAESHMRNIASHPHADLRALAGRNHDKTSEVAARYGAPLVFDGYEDMIGSGEVDAVLILAPDALHEQIAVEAFSAGLHVLCEKPLSTTAASARRMMDAACESELVNMSYFALRTSAHHQLVKTLLDENAIGEIRSASFSLIHGLFRGPDYNWRFDATHGGGVIADLGCYLFDQSLWYIGDVAAVAVDATSFGTRGHPEGHGYPPAPDSAAGVLRFRGGAHATFDVSVVSHVGAGFQRNTIVLQGEHGRIQLDHTFADATVRIIRDDENTATLLNPTADLADLAGDAAFVDAILGSGRVQPSFEDGWRVQEVVAAAERAAASRTWADVGGADA